MGAAVYEGMASTLEEAAEMAASGKIHFISNHSMHCVGPNLIALPRQRGAGTRGGSFCFIML